MPDENNQLIGIKAIAGYLDMSVRNVYYWEKKLGLPVHRVSGRSGYRIYAFKEEIDQWLQDKDVKSLRSSKNRFMSIAVITAPIILAIVLLLTISPFAGEKGKSGWKYASVEHNLIHMKDARGRTLWVINHGYETNNRGLYAILDRADIDGDGYDEVIACTYNSLDDSKHCITLFDHDGSILWKRHVQAHFTFKKAKISNQFRPSPVKFAVTRDKKTVIITKWVNQPRFLSIISSHDLEGNLLSQYHHTGHVDPSMKLIDLDGDGEVEIYFSGTNNLLDAEGFLCALPLTNFQGINPPNRIEPEYVHRTHELDKYIADHFVPGNQLLYLRFKRTAHIPKHRASIINSEIESISAGQIMVFLKPWEIKSGEVSLGLAFQFDDKFTLIDVMVPTAEKKKYTDLYEQGDLAIPVEELIRIYGKIVYRWQEGNWIPVRSTIQD